MAAVNVVMETPAVDLGALLDAGDSAVVTLEAGETRLAAHRAVLAARSPVFEAMFRHDTLEASSGHVSVTDVEGAVLRQLLAYCYTLKAPQLPNMEPQLLAAADKYGLSALKDVCEQQLVTQLSMDNAAASAVLAVRHSCPNLTEAAVSFIKANLQVMATQGWADAMLSQPQDLIEVSRLIAEPPAETRTPATAEGGTSRGPQPRSDDSDRGRQTAASARRRTPPSDDAAVSRLRSLSRDERGRRLIQAAKEGAVEKLRALLAAGTDVGARGSDRETALHWAAVYGHVAAVRFLVESGAEVDAREFRQITPLHGAAWNGHAEAAAALLEAGADRGAMDVDGDTPLDLARQRNQQELIQMLSRR